MSAFFWQPKKTPGRFKPVFQHFLWRQKKAIIMCQSDVHSQQRFFCQMETAEVTVDQAGIGMGRRITLLELRRCRWSDKWQVISSNIFVGWICSFFLAWFYICKDSWQRWTNIHHTFRKKTLNLKSLQELFSLSIPGTPWLLCGGRWCGVWDSQVSSAGLPSVTSLTSFEVQFL